MAVSLSAEEASPAPDRAARAGVWRVFALLIGFLILDTLRGALIGEKTIFLFKEEMHLSPGAVTSLRLVEFIPLYFQPFIGAATEIFPLFGYRRRSYFAVAALLSIITCIGLASLRHYPIAGVLPLLILGAAGATLRLVVFNAVVVSLGNRLGNLKQIQTVQQLLPLILTASFAGQFGGYVTEHWSYPAAFGTCAVVTLLFLSLIPLIDEPEPMARRAEDEALNDHQAQRRARMAAIRAALSDRRLWPVVAFVAAIGLTPSPNTAQPYFFKDGLHLSKEYIGQLNGWLAGGSLVGLALGQFIPRQAKLWQLATLVAVFNVLTYLPSFFMRDALSAKIAMTTQGVLGPFVLISYGWMMARACARGSEATIFGLLMATQALFYLICDWIGSHLYDWFGPAAGYSPMHGWLWAIGISTAAALPTLIFIPFLPRTDPAETAPTP